MRDRVRRLRERVIRLAAGERRNQRAGNWERVRFYRKRRVQAKRELAAARAELAPRIVKATGVHWGSPFGGLGQIYRSTIHYTAGARDESVDDAIRLCRQYARAHHATYGSQGIGYHLNFVADGTIICLRKFTSKGAHVGGENAGNVGTVFHGTTGDKPTEAQEASFKWWLRHGHTKAMPRGYRTPKAPRALDVRGHREWPNQATQCPGAFIVLKP